MQITLTKINMTTIDITCFSSRVSKTINKVFQILHSCSLQLADQYKNDILITACECWLFLLTTSTKHLTQNKALFLVSGSLLINPFCNIIQNSLVWTTLLCAITGKYMANSMNNRLYSSARCKVPMVDQNN